MTLPNTVIDAMIEAGCSAEQLAAAMKAANADAEARAQHKREVDAARKRRQRERDAGVSRTVTRTARDSTDSLAGVTRVEDKPLPTEIEPQEGKKENARAALSPGFDEFWSLFPNKVGKAEAVKAFAKAAKLVDLATMMAGLRRYVAKTDDRPWCNPATWLNQARWDDQPAVVVPMARAGPAQRPTLIDLIDQKMGVSHADPRPAQTAVLDLPAAAYGHR
jgi:hypothetical protein